MLKGRSKSFAPKSLPRAPKRKAQDDAPEPANRVSMTPDRPAEPTPEITREEKRAAQEDIEEPPAKRVSIAPEQPSIPTSGVTQVEKRKAQDGIEEPPAKRVSIVSDQLSDPTCQAPQSETTASAPDNTHTPVEAVPAPTANRATMARAKSPDTIVGQPIPRDESQAVAENPSAAPTREPVPSARIAPELGVTAQDTPQTGNGAKIEVPQQNAVPSTNADPANTASSTNSNAEVPSSMVEAPPVPSNTSQTNLVEETVLPSVERSDTPAVTHNERAVSPSPTPAQTSTAANAFRYPSPENMTRLVESEPIGTPADMGPPGGQLGAAGDTAIMRSGEVVQMATLNPDGTTGGIVVPEPSPSIVKGKKKKRVVKKKKVLTAEATSDEARATIEIGLKKARRQVNQRPRKKDKEDGPEKKRKEREETPLEAEEEIIDATTLTMQELCQDLRIGKKFSRHDEIKQRILKKKQEAVRNKMRGQDEDVAARLDQEDEEDEARFARNAAAARLAAAASGASPDPPIEEVAQPEPAENAGGGGIGFNIVNGQIVVDQQSAQLNLRAQGAKERAGYKEVVEDDFSKIFTSGTHMKREKNNSWDPVSTEEFYKYLGQFGTDFETIAKLFPGRSRRQIKLKFNTEEKKNAAKITRFLTNPKAAMDLENFEQQSGDKLESVEEIHAEIEKEVAEKEAQFKAQEEELRAAEKAKKAKINETRLKRLNGKDAVGRILDSVEVGSDGEDDAPRRSAGESSKENAAPTTGKGKRKTAASKKVRKNKHSHTAGGDEVFVLGSIG